MWPPSYWIGILSIDLHIPMSGSLKSKRRVLKSIKDRVRSRFNVSVAEVADHDKWQRCSLGVAMVGVDKPHIEGALQGVLSLVEGVHDAEVLNHEIEFD